MKKIIILIFTIIQIISISVFSYVILKCNIAFNLMSILLCLIYYKVNKKIFKMDINVRKKIVVFLLGTLLSLTIFIGASLGSGRGITNIYYIMYIIMLSLLNSPVFAYGFAKIFDILENYNIIEEKDRKLSIKVFLLICGIIILLWIPVLLAYYPGIFDYDVHTQLSYVEKNSYSTHHPLIHTAILGFFYNIGIMIGNNNIGVLLYTVIQLIILASIISYAIMYLWKKGINKKILYVIVAFYAIFPLNSIMSISITKDVYFSGLVLAFFIAMLKLRDEGWNFNLKNYTFFVCTTVLMLLFRTNASYALIISIIGIVFLGVRKYKNILIAIILSLILFYLAEFGLEIKYNAYTKNEKDMLSIPLQQLARVGSIYRDDITEEEIKEIRYYVSPQKYNQYLSDPIKNSTDISKIRKDYKAFFSTWFKYLQKFPTVYIESFLYNTKGFWDINDITHSEIYGINVEKRTGYLLTGTKEGYGVTHISYNNFLDMLYEKLFTENNYQKIPIVSLLFSPATYMWIYLIYLMFAIYKKDKNSIMVDLFFGGMFVTFLVGPTCLIRYVYPLVICAPILICDIFVNKRNKG